MSSWNEWMHMLYMFFIRVCASEWDKYMNTTQRTTKAIVRRDKQQTKYISLLSLFLLRVIINY